MKKFFKNWWKMLLLFATLALDMLSFAKGLSKATQMAATFIALVALIIAIPSIKKIFGVPGVVIVALLIVIDLATVIVAVLTAIS